jgi:hypothetical protein
MNNLSKLSGQKQWFTRKHPRSLSKREAFQSVNLRRNLTTGRSDIREFTEALWAKRPNPTARLAWLWLAQLDYSTTPPRPPFYTITRSTPGNSCINRSCSCRLVQLNNRLPGRTKTTWVMPYSRTNETSASATFSCLSEITRPPIF